MSERTAPYTATAAPIGTVAAVFAVVAGIGTFSAMDAAMKGASIAAGVYTALLLRNLLGSVFTLPVWLASKPRIPGAPIVRLHAFRAVIITIMAALFFFGLVRIPMAEAIAISFISPIIALFLASALLGEVIRPQAILASLFGIGGVLVIGGGRLGGFDADSETLIGITAVLCSALFYAFNLVLQRKQALLAGPVEITFFQNVFATILVALPAPWLLVMPDAKSWAMIAAAAILATIAHMCLSWGYARAETQVLAPVEYTGFLWAALFGWLFFNENITVATIAGALLIVAGCWIGTRNKVSPA